MTLQLTVCSAVAGAGRCATTLLPDHDALIDADAGVRALDIEDIARIDYAVVTHSHLDCVALLPFMAYTAGETRERPITARSLPGAIDNRRGCLFNPELWPDFSEISDAEHQVLRYAPFTLGKSVTLDHCRADTGGPRGVNGGLLAKELAKPARNAKIRITCLEQGEASVRAGNWRRRGSGK